MGQNKYFELRNYVLLSNLLNYWST